MLGRDEGSKFPSDFVDTTPSVRLFQSETVLMKKLFFCRCLKYNRASGVKFKCVY